MIKRFKNRLRMAGLEDRLQSELGLSDSANSWLFRLAKDCAQQNGLDLLSVRCDVIADSVFWQLERSGHANLLNKLAKDSTQLSAKLDHYRSSRVAKAA